MNSMGLVTAFATAILAHLTQYSISFKGLNSPHNLHNKVLSSDRGSSLSNINILPYVARDYTSDPRDGRQM